MPKKTGVYTNIKNFHIKLSGILTAVSSLFILTHLYERFTTEGLNKISNHGIEKTFEYYSYTTSAQEDQAFHENLEYFRRATVNTVPIVGAFVAAKFKLISHVYFLGKIPGEAMTAGVYGGFETGITQIFNMFKQQNTRVETANTNIPVAEVVPPPVNPANLPGVEVVPPPSAPLYPTLR